MDAGLGLSSLLPASRWAGFSNVAARLTRSGRLAMFAAMRRGPLAGASLWSGALKRDR